MLIKNTLKNFSDSLRKNLNKERTDLPTVNIFRSAHKMKNKLKYKNQITFLGKLRKRLIEATNWNYSEVVVAKIPVNLEGYKYLHRHLVKVNRVFKGSLIITLNKTEYAGEMGYTAVVSLKVIR